jgi:hypothetical protein
MKRGDLNHTILQFSPEEIRHMASGKVNVMEHPT